LDTIGIATQSPLVVIDGLDQVHAHAAFGSCVAVTLCNLACPTEPTAHLPIQMSGYSSHGVPGDVTADQTGIRARNPMMMSVPTSPSSLPPVRRHQLDNAARTTDR
jgi:hypothetical protein